MKFMSRAGVYWVLPSGTTAQTIQSMMSEAKKNHSQNLIFMCIVNGRVCAPWFHYERAGG